MASSSRPSPETSSLAVMEESRSSSDFRVDLHHATQAARLVRELLVVVVVVMVVTAATTAATATTARRLQSLHDVSPLHISLRPPPPTRLYALETPMTSATPVNLPLAAGPGCKASAGPSVRLQPQPQAPTPLGRTRARRRREARGSGAGATARAPPVTAPISHDPVRSNFPRPPSPSPSSSPTRRLLPPVPPVPLVPPLTRLVLLASPPASNHVQPYRSSLPPTSPPFFPNAYHNYTSRPSTTRASLPTQFVPNGYWDFQRDLPRMQRARQNSLTSSSDRSSFDSRFERSVSFGSAATSSRTSIDSTWAKTSRPDVPLRTASWNGQFVPEHLPPRPAQLLRPQRLADPAPRLLNTPGEAFGKLPREILTLIADAVRMLHLGGGMGSETCPTCCMRDICSLSLTCRNWAVAARPTLYGNIWLVGPDSLGHIKKRFRIKAGSRLKLLRRTLRGNATLARLVKALKVPDVDTAMTKKESEGYLDLVASVVMSCPNLERLLGLYPAYEHEFSRLVHALSTRTKLVEQMWNVMASPHQRRRNSTKEAIPLYSLVPEVLSRDERGDFLSHHSNWDHLSTLAINCNAGGAIDPRLLSEVVGRLPSLKHLALSAFPNTSHNLLASLPPLKSLHLAHLPSLQDHDLSSFATSPAAQTLTSLTLIDVNLTSLPLLARLFANLASLERFTLKQDLPPTLAAGDSIFLHPYLASHSLRHLAWDILTPNEEDPSNDATIILAKAIRHSGFPALRVLKAPCDHDGILQSLCRPTERVTSAYESGNWKPGTLIDLIDERRKDSGVEVADSGYGSTYGGFEYTRSLRAARLAAQSRIELARSRPKIQIIAEDWTDYLQGNIIVTARYEAGAYIGMVSSKIRYALEPEVEGRDELGVSVGDLIEITGAEGKGEGSRRGGCDGRWNIGCDGGKGGWEHRERPRWSPVGVGVLF